LGKLFVQSGRLAENEFSRPHRFRKYRAHATTTAAKALLAESRRKSQIVRQTAQSNVHYTQQFHSALSQFRFIKEIGAPTIGILTIEDFQA
jgi:hypothetical protein